MEAKPWVKINQTGVGLIQNMGRLLQVPIQEKKVTRELINHPYFPSLASLSEVLEKNGMHNEALIFDDAECSAVEFMQNLPLPFITELVVEANQKAGIIVTEIQDDRIEYLDPAHGYITEDFALFMGKWLRFVLLVEPAVTEPDVTFKTRTLKLYKVLAVFVPLILMLSTIVIFIANGNYSGIVLSLFATLGTYASFSIIHEEVALDGLYSYSNRIIRNFSFISINSEMQSLIRFSGLSELFMTFYQGTSLLLFLVGVFEPSGMLTPAVITACISFVGVAFSFVLLYYQVKIIRGWVFGYNIISLFNWIIFIVSLRVMLSYYPGLVTISPLIVLAALNIYLVLYLFTAAFRQWITTSEEFFFSNVKVDHLVKSDWFFDALKENSEKEIDPIELNDLVFGNPENPKTAIVVLSPYSKRSKELYRILDKAQSQNKIKKYKIIIRMMVPTAADAFGSGINKLILRRFIFQNETQEEKKKCFDRAFGLKDLIRSKFFEASLSEDFDWNKAVARMMHWKEVNGIERFPALIVDNVIVPEIFIFNLLPLLISSDE